MENANLSGVGVFGAQDGLVFRMRGVGSGDDIVNVSYNGTTKVIEIWLRKDKLLMQQVWTNATVRQNAAPDFQGQLGVTRSDNSLWLAFGVLTGQWEPVKAQQTFADNAARATATPAFLGQLSVQINTGALYRGSGTNPGNWTLIP